MKAYLLCLRYVLTCFCEFAKSDCRHFQCGAPSRFDRLIPLTVREDNVYRCVLFLVPSLTHTPTFTVSGSIKSPLNERSRNKRPPLLSRLLAPDFLLYLAYSTYVFVPIFQWQMISYSNSAYPLSLSFPFPALLSKCLALGWAASSPVRYMVSPPDAPEWEELVEEGDDGVKRPKGRWRGGGDKRGGVGYPWLIFTACEFGIIWASWIT